MLPLVGLASVYGRISHGLIVATYVFMAGQPGPHPGHRTPLEIADLMIRA